MIMATHGAILAKLGRWAEAESTLGKAIDILRGQLRQYPENNDIRFLLADSLKELAGALAPQPARRTEAISFLNEAIGLVEPLVSRFPSTVFYARYVALLRADRGAVRGDAGQLDGAQEDLEFARRSLAQRWKRKRMHSSPCRTWEK